MNDDNLILSHYLVPQDNKRKKRYLIVNLITLPIFVILYSAWQFLFLIPIKNILPTLTVVINHTTYNLGHFIGWLLFFGLVIALFGYLVKVITKTYRVYDTIYLRLASNKITITMMFIIAYFVVTYSSSKLALPFNKPASIFLTVLEAVIAGICEEFLFRGQSFNIGLVIFNNAKYQIVYASIFSCVIFGLAHSLNLLHQPYYYTLMQIVNAAAFGFTFLFAYLLTNKLYFPILLHIWSDIIPEPTGKAMAKITLPESLTAMVPALIIILISIILLISYNRDYLHRKMLNMPYYMSD